MTRIVGSKWTALEDTLGWRHFTVVQLRKAGQAPGQPTVFVLMQASCDSSAQLWVNAQNLRDRSNWAAGWLQRAEMIDPEGVMRGTQAECKVCAGLGRRPCPACKAGRRLSGGR